MDAKDTWPVVKFLIAATGLKRRDAREMLKEMPKDRYSQLFIQARAWDRDTATQASKALSNLLGDEQLSTLVEATRRAQVAVSGNDPDDEPEPARRPRRKK